MKPFVENTGQFHIIPGIGVVEIGQVVPVPEHNVINVHGENTGVDCESSTGVVVISSNGMPMVECGHANTIGVRFQCCAGW